MIVKPKRAARESFEEFVFWVRSPSAAYSFGVRHDKHADDPYDERQSLRFNAICIYPDRFKEWTADAHLFGSDDLVPGALGRRDRREKLITAIGYVSCTKTRFEISGSVACETLWHLGHAMAVGTVTSMLANCQMLTRGKGKVKSMSFHGPDFDPVGYVG